MYSLVIRKGENSRGGFNLLYVPACDDYDCRLSHTCVVGMNIENAKISSAFLIGTMFSPDAELPVQKKRHKTRNVY
jgi:hypothetical protein